MLKVKFIFNMSKIKSVYKISDQFSSSELQETDFGRIYFATPKEVYSPENIEDLANLLKDFNSRKVPVIIRNTGHSMNGQTITSGVQIQIGKIRGISFNKNLMEVIAGCGNTWDEVLQAIKLPNFCLPVFPNNPGQQIHIGGTVAVGGIGPYSSSMGGFWNHILKLKLVTMTGEIIECSPFQNSDYFKYSLAGFGRIGVIAEITIRVVPSKKYVSMFAIGCLNLNQYMHVLKTACELDELSAVNGFTQVSHEKIIDPLRIFPYSVVAAVEVDSEKEMNDIAKILERKFPNEFEAFVRERVKNKPDSLDLCFKPHLTPKKDYVYFYPRDHKETSGLLNPWNDYILPEEHYQTFVDRSYPIIRKYGLAKYFLHESMIHAFLNFDMYASYPIKRIKSSIDFPLTLDFPSQERAYHIGLSLVVPPHLIDSSFSMIDELTKLCFELGGKRYLYGSHRLTKDQVEKQFTKSVIDEWNKIKNKLDPHHLLNIGVIEHLDN